MSSIRWMRSGRVAGRLVTGAIERLFDGCANESPLGRIACGRHVRFAAKRTQRASKLSSLLLTEVLVRRGSVRRGTWNFMLTSTNLPGDPKFELPKRPLGHAQHYFSGSSDEDQTLPSRPACSRARLNP